MSIDRADWHWDGAEAAYRARKHPNAKLSGAEQDEIWLYAADHIGLFLRWIFENGYEGEESDPEGVKRVRGGEISGAEYLMSCCDGKFWDTDIRKDIAPFVNEYYEQYIGDYTKNICMGDSYSVLSGDREYEIIRPIIDKAFADFSKKN